MPTHSTVGTGQNIATATCDLLLEWGCADCIQCMVFDTTSANTGHLTAACISIQDKLQRQLLWCACRHHVGEVILTHVWDALKIETSKSPDVSIFTRLRDNFSSMTSNDTSNLKSSPEIDSTHHIRQFCKAKLEGQSFSRGDYRELLELVCMYVTGEFTFPIHRPGALHKARWMAKLIYCLKLALLETKITEELPKGTIFASGQMQKLKRFIDFCVCAYIPWWFEAYCPEKAPQKDLLLWQALKDYPDEIVSASGVKAFSKHLWYLTEELVLLSLFDDDVKDIDKETIASKLLSVDEIPTFADRFGSGYGKPLLPKAENKTGLADFVGSSSWPFLQMMQVDSGFLHLPVSEWCTHEGYLGAVNTIKNIRVVNDSAERGVKLSTDFLSSALIEKRYQNVLQVVENDRAKIPNQRKKSSQSWFLHL